MTRVLRAAAVAVAILALSGCSAFTPHKLTDSNIRGAWVSDDTPQSHLTIETNGDFSLTNFPAGIARLRGWTGRASDDPSPSPHKTGSPSTDSGSGTWVIDDGTPSLPQAVLYLDLSEGSFPGTGVWLHATPGNDQTFKLELRLGNPDGPLTVYRFHRVDPPKS